MLFKKTAYCLFVALFSLALSATEPVAYGKIKTLTYRGGWVMFIDLIQ